jgi:PRTRC genetic system protein B
MNNITSRFDEVYLPVKALVIYRSQQEEDAQIYVESYDMDDSGRPINAHPLDMQESAILAKALDSSDELQRDFLKPKKLLSENVLYINPSYDGCVVWHTPAQEADVLFVKELGIPNGKAKVPALLWKADKEHLHIYALKNNKRPVENTPLYYAPFFNMYEDGTVCMGTVNVEIEASTCLEDFISQWQHYFFGSYFSHLISGHKPVKNNIVQLWQEQVNRKQDFPNEVLIKSTRTIKDLIR